MEKPSARIEFVVHKPDELVQFYEAVLGWKALTKDPETQRWTIFPRPPGADTGQPLSGTRIIERTIAASTSLLCNFEVKSINETTQLVLDNGGHLFVPEGGAPNPEPMLLPGVGKQQYFCDPEGNMFGAVEFDA